MPWNLQPQEVLPTGRIPRQSVRVLRIRYRMRHDSQWAGTHIQRVHPPGQLLPRTGRIRTGIVHHPKTGRTSVRKNRHRKCSRKGGTFKVSMPLPSISPKPAPDTKEPAITLPKIHLRIAIIDDDRIQMHLTEAMLHNAAEEVKGFKVETVCWTAGRNLSNSSRTITFDLVFTDIQMPAMNGLNCFITFVTRILPQAPVHSGHCHHSPRGYEWEWFSTKGFAGMLQKPLNQSELKKVVKCTEPPHRIGQYSWHLLVQRTPTKLRHTQTSLITFSPLTAFSEDDRKLPKRFCAPLHRNTKNMESYKLPSVAKIWKPCVPPYKMLPTFPDDWSTKGHSLCWNGWSNNAAHRIYPEAEQAAETVIAETKAGACMQNIKKT